MRQRRIVFTLKAATVLVYQVGEYTALRPYLRTAVADGNQFEQHTGMLQQLVGQIRWLLIAFDEDIDTNNLLTGHFSTFQHGVFFQLKMRWGHGHIRQHGLGAMSRQLANVGNDGIGKLRGVDTRNALIAKVAGMNAAFEGKEQCIFNMRCTFHKAQVTQHSNAAQQQRSGVGNVFTRNIRSSAMHGFENADMVADVGAGCKTQATHQTSAKIADDIALQVGKHHHIKAVGAGYEFHAEVIYNYIVGLQIGVFFSHFVKHFQEEAVGNFHDIGLVTAGNAAGTFLLGHFKSVANHLLTTGAGNETAAQGYVVGEHVLNTAVGIFNVFTNHGYINGDTGFAKHGIYAVQGLKHPLVGVGVPGFTGCYVYTFYAFALGGFHGAFEQDAQCFDGLLGFGGHAIAVTFVEYPFAHVDKLVLQRYAGSVKDSQHGVHYFRTDTISFGNCDFHK